MYQSLSLENDSLMMPWEWERIMFGKEKKSSPYLELVEEQVIQSGSFWKVLRWIFSNRSRKDFAPRVLQGTPALA